MLVTLSVTAGGVMLQLRWELLPTTPITASSSLDTALGQNSVYR